MHIGYVTTAYHGSADDIWMPSVVATLERVAAVHDVTVISLRHPGRRAPFDLAGARVFALGHGQAGGAVGRVRVLGDGLVTVLRRHRKKPIDIVHGLWIDEPGAVATVAARLMRRTSVISTMGGELVGLRDIGYGAALGRGGRLTVRVALRLASTVTAQSSTTADLVSARGRPDVRILPLGVDRQLFHAGEAARPTNERPRVLFVGNLASVKDPLLLVRAFARIATAHDAFLDIVGDGSLRADVTSTAAELGIADRVVLHGQLARRELAQMYRAVSVLAVPSRHESQSVVAVEAVASGLPVVGTRVGILPDLGAAALTVPVGDEAALADALAAVLGDPARARAMSAAGRDVAARLDVDATSGELLKLYDELSAGGRSR